MHYVNTMEPKYSSIDLTEVELPETDNDHNANSEIERDDENTNTLHDVSIRSLALLLSSSLLLLLVVFLLVLHRA